MVNVAYEIERLIKFAVRKKMITVWDIIPVRNSLMAVLNVEEPFQGEVKDDARETPVEILENILDYAYEKGIIEENTTTYRDLLDAKIMGLVMPTEGQVVKKFYEKAEKNSIEKATDWYYDLSKSSNYIMTERVNKNLWWLAPTEYGDLEITVNLSKPEKDPKEIAKAKLMKAATYPKCLLCVENVGYQGRLNHPARQNHRVIPLELQNKQWYMQYSPYVYYNEHCIVFSGKHEPMKLTKDSLTRLVEFIDKFPHYFIGSNADLPIVGGSILTHDHYQGGRYEFAMAKAKDVYNIEIDGYEDIKISIIKWPLSVVRLNGKNRERISELGNKILNHWRNYSDEKVNILSHSEDIPHNTITPIARKREENFELDLVLRNNRCSEKHPDGIFHPHKELHHIKKENIGLIEVLGLAVLPARLKEELSHIKECLLDENRYYEIIQNETLKPHLSWFNEIKDKYNDINKNNIDKIIEDEVGFVFEKVLEDCGVFKWDKEGKEAMSRYINDLKISIEKVKEYEV